MKEKVTVKTKSLHELVSSGDLLSIALRNPDLEDFITHENNGIKIATQNKKSKVIQYIYKRVKEELFSENILDKTKKFFDNQPKVDAKGRTQLHWTIACGLIEETNILLEKIPNKNDLVLADEEGNSLLHYACCYEHFEIVSLLLSTNRVDVNFPNKQGMTPLCSAVMENVHVKIIDLLLTRGADVNHADAKNNTPLSIAICQNNPNVVQRLVADLHMDLAPYVCMAAEKGYLEVLKILSKGHIGNHHLHIINALKLAVDHQHFDIVKYLLSRGLVINELEKGEKSLFDNVPKERKEFLVLWQLKEKNKEYSLSRQVIEILRTIKDESLFSFFQSDNTFEPIRKLIPEIQREVVKSENLVGSIKTLMEKYALHIPSLHFNFIMEFVLSNNMTRVHVEDDTNSASTDNTLTTGNIPPSHVDLDEAKLTQLPTELLLNILDSLKNPIYFGRLSQVNKAIHKQLMNPPTKNWYWHRMYERDFGKENVLSEIDWQTNYIKTASLSHGFFENDAFESYRRLRIYIKSGDLHSILQQKEKYHYDAKIFLLNVSEKAYQYNNCITAALAHGHLHIVKYIYECAKIDLFTKRKIIELISEEERRLRISQIHWSIACGLLEETKQLYPLVQEGLMQRTDNVGNTLLHYACAYNHPDIVKFLISCGENVNITNNTYMTPLSIAVHNNASIETIHLLKKSNINHRHISVWMFWGARIYSTPIALSIENNNLEMTRFLAKLFKYHKMNLNDNCITTNRGGRVDSPLTWAAKNTTSNGKIDIVEALIDAGADPKIIKEHYNFNGEILARYSALTLAVDAKNFAMAKCLIDAGASLNELESCYNLDNIRPNERIQFRKLWEIKENNKHLLVQEQVVEILKCNVNEDISTDSPTKDAYSHAHALLIKIIEEISVNPEEQITLLRNICNEHKQYIPELNYKFIMECLLSDEMEEKPQLRQALPNSLSQ